MRLRNGVVERLQGTTVQNLHTAHNIYKYIDIYIQNRCIHLSIDKNKHDWHCAQSQVWKHKKGALLNSENVSGEHFKSENVPGEHFKSENVPGEHF